MPATEHKRPDGSTGFGSYCGTCGAPMPHANMVGHGEGICEANPELVRKLIKANSRIEPRLMHGNEYFEIDMIKSLGQSDEFIGCPQVDDFADCDEDGRIENFYVNGDPYVDQIVNPHAMCAPFSRIVIQFDYPLRRTVEIVFENEGGFSVMEIFKAVYDGYKSIYTMEERATGDPGNIPGMLNRASSDGPIGIWGHGLEDLFLECIIHLGNGVYKLGMGS